MKRTIIAAALALASISAHAQSWLQFEGAVGVNAYQVTDGTWNQEGAAYNHVKTVFPAAQLGARFNVWQRGDYGVTLHTDLVYLGRVSSDCWCTESDADYNLGTKHTTPGAQTAHFVGHGNAIGVALTVEPYYTMGAWRFGVEGGLFPYRPQWDETVSNYVWNPAYPATTVCAHTTNSLQLGFLVGASVERGAFGVSLRHYFLQPFGTLGGTPPIYNTSTVLMVTYHY